jgi:SlyX protein
MSQPSTDDARIELLELKIAHLERTSQELSDVLYRQQRELDALAVRVREGIEQAQSAPGADAATSVEIPPHY